MPVDNSRMSRANASVSLKALGSVTRLHPESSKAGCCAPSGSPVIIRQSGLRLYVLRGDSTKDDASCATTGAAQTATGVRAIPIHIRAQNLILTSRCCISFVRDLPTVLRVDMNSHHVRINPTLWQVRDL